MSIEHVNIADPNIHEPKGISTASNKQVYVADGLGTGTWKQLATEDIQYHGIHGVMAITNNSTAFAVTAVADTTFNTPSQYSLFTGTGAGWAGEYNNGITFSTDKLTVPVAGIYKIDLWGNINTFPANNAKVSVRYRINGSTFSSRKPTVKTDSSASPRLISGFGLLQLAANDYIQLYVASDSTGDIVFNDLNTTLTLVRTV